MRTLVTAAPAREESNTRRSWLPNVEPNPRSSGSIVNVPRFCSTDSLVIRGIWKSSMRVLTSSWSSAGLLWHAAGSCLRGPASLGPRAVVLLLRVQLDDELLLHR